MVYGGYSSYSWWGGPPMDGPRVSEAMATGGTVPCELRWIWDGEHLGCSEGPRGWDLLESPTQKKRCIQDLTAYFQMQMRWNKWWLNDDWMTEDQMFRWIFLKIPDGPGRWNMLKRGNYWDAQSRQLEFMRNHPKALKFFGKTIEAQRYVRGLLRLIGWIWMMFDVCWWFCWCGSCTVALSWLWTFTNHI